MTETVRETCEIGTDGRNTIPNAVQRAVNIKGKKAYCQVENYGENKILFTILSRWEPNKRIKGKVQNR